MLSSVFVGPNVTRTKAPKNPTKVDDVWAMGYIVMEMWTGRKPWGDADSFSAMMQLAGNAPPPLDTHTQFSPGAEEFRLQCLATDPAKRQSAGDIKNHPYLTLPQGWRFTGDFTRS
jgi:mitogen-activated protein kinase kinase kinase